MTRRCWFAGFCYLSGAFWKTHLLSGPLTTPLAKTVQPLLSLPCSVALCLTPTQQLEDERFPYIVRLQARLRLLTGAACDHTISFSGGRLRVAIKSCHNLVQCELTGPFGLTAYVFFSVGDLQAVSSDSHEDPSLPTNTCLASLKLFNPWTM